MSLDNEEREFYPGTFTFRPRVVESFAVYHCVKTQPLIETLINLVKAFYRYFESETATKFDTFTDVSSDSDGRSNHSDKFFTNVNPVKNATQTCNSCNSLKIKERVRRKKTRDFKTF